MKTASIKKLQNCCLDVSQVVSNGFCLAYSASLFALLRREIGNDREAREIEYSITNTRKQEVNVFDIRISDLASPLWEPNFQGSSSTFSASSFDFCGKMKASIRVRFLSFPPRSSNTDCRRLAQQCSISEARLLRTCPGEGLEGGRGRGRGARNGEMACVLILEPAKDIYFSFIHGPLNRRARVLNSLTFWHTRVQLLKKCPR